MARITSEQRKHVPKSKEGNPAKHGKVGAYPLTDKAHCKAAVGLAGMHNAPASVKKRIDEKCGFNKKGKK